MFYLDLKFDDLRNLFQFLLLTNAESSYLVKIECNRYSIQTLQHEILLGIYCKIDTRCKNTHRVFIVWMQPCCKILIQPTKNKIWIVQSFHNILVKLLLLYVNTFVLGCLHVFKEVWAKLVWLCRHTTKCH